MGGSILQPMNLEDFSYLCPIQGAKCLPSRCSQQFHQALRFCLRISPTSKEKWFILRLSEANKIHLVHFSTQHKPQTLQRQECRCWCAEEKKTFNREDVWVTKYLYGTRIAYASLFLPWVCSIGAAIGCLCLGYARQVGDYSSASFALRISDLIFSSFGHFSVQEITLYMARKSNSCLKSFGTLNSLLPGFRDFTCWKFHSEYDELAIQDNLAFGPFR